MLHSGKRETGVGGINIQDLEGHRPFWLFQKNLLTLNLLLVGALVCGTTNGYDGSLLNGLQSLDTWQDFFGSPEGAWLGLIVSANRLGALVALPFISPLQTRLGRRWPIAIGSSIIVVGVILHATARNTTMFIVGRAILGFGNQIQMCTCPVLIAELAYPKHRATYTALTNTTGSIGNIIAAWTTFGTSKLQPQSISWRLPVAIQAASSIFQFIMVFFVPESPRWLVKNGRESEARDILVKYHGAGDERSELVHFEMTEITYTLEKDKRKSSWSAWFRGPANRHRFAIIFTLPWITQWAGNAIISYYLKLLLESFGIMNSTTQLLINGGNTISSWCFAVLWACTIDFFGRRKLFLTGIAGMFCSFLTMTVLAALNAGSDFTKNGYAGGAVAMVFSFGAFYKMAGTTQDPYYSEIAPYELRDKAFVIKQLVDCSANIFSGFVNPIALDAIGWRYFIVWCCLLVSHFTVVFFLYPETKNLSLEEITQMFDGTDVPSDAIGQHSAKAESSSAVSRSSSADKTEETLNKLG